MQMKPEMKKPMTYMLIILAAILGVFFLYKGVTKLIENYFFASNKNPVMTVSTAKATMSTWQSEVKAVGSLRATLGVNITAQLGGMIQTISLTPGAFVNKNDVLVQQNANSDIAQLHALEANAELARITFERDKSQYQIKAVSKQQLDSDEQNLKSLRAQVAQQAAIVAKLTIQAPFNGQLGISKVNPGQYLNPGDTVVTLQRLDPVYVDFYLPQQNLKLLKKDLEVNLTVDAYPDQVFIGKITTINPLVEVGSRNVEVEATLRNPNFQLVPGMFANVSVLVGKSQNYITIPQTAVSFNPYGDIVFIVKEKGKDKKNKPILYVNQVFVETGERRGEQVSIIRGLKVNDEIVTSGQLKLKNGTFITINNAIQPPNLILPDLPDEHGG